MVQVNETTIQIDSPLGNKVELIDLSAKVPGTVAIRISGLQGNGYKMATVSLEELREALQSFKLPIAA